MKRIPRNRLFMEAARLFSARGTCERAVVGAVIVKDGRIISTGYNGAPAGLDHCTDVGCDTAVDGSCQRAIHAETNAIAFSAKEGISTKDTTMYSTVAPCKNCAMLIVNAGIKKVVYQIPYKNTTGLVLLKKAGVETELYSDEDTKQELHPM